MRTFVKVAGYENWFLLLKSVSEVPERLSEVMQQRLIQSESGHLFTNERGEPNNLLSRLNIVCHNPPDYKGILARYNEPILVRPIGSYMMLSDNEITDTVHAKEFPEDNENAKIVICENDEKAEPHWLEYLSERFPGKSVRTLNFFRTRELDSLKEIFEKVKFITFSTTFTKFDWFELLVAALPENFTGKIIGSCPDENSWIIAKEILAARNYLDKLEIVNPAQATT